MNHQDMLLDVERCGKQRFEPASMTQQRCGGLQEAPIWLVCPQVECLDTSDS